MITKVREVEKAIELRKKGYSYNDILKEVPVSKSTLSKYLKDLPLTQQEKQYLKTRNDSNISKGRVKAATAHRMRRIVRDGFLFQEARKEYLVMEKDPFFHIGICLYWAEGSKRNQIFAFTNSDADMIKLMVVWIERFLGVSKSDIKARLFTHKPFAQENNEKYWSDTSGIPLENFRKTIYKPTGLLVKKHPNYKGCLRIELGKVVYLRKIAFWQKMMVEYYRKQGYPASTPL